MRHYAIENGYDNPDYKGMTKKQIRKSVNQKDQIYKGIKINCIARHDYQWMKAKRFTLNGTNQNVWIPNKHLEADGTVKPGENIDYVFLRRWKQCTKAGIDLSCIQGSKGWNFRKWDLEHREVKEEVCDYE